MATPGPTGQQGALVAQDDTRVLQRLFTGHIVAGAAAGATYMAKVNAATATAVSVTITTFPRPTQVGVPPPLFTCYYEPKPQASGTTKKPPIGTACVVAFPSNHPLKYGVVLAFIGWP